MDLAFSALPSKAYLIWNRSRLEDPYMEKAGSILLQTLPFHNRSDARMAVECLSLGGWVVAHLYGKNDVPKPSI